MSLNNINFDTYSAKIGFYSFWVMSNTKNKSIGKIKKILNFFGEFLKNINNSHRCLK